MCKCHGRDRKCREHRGREVMSGKHTSYIRLHEEGTFQVTPKVRISPGERVLGQRVPGGKSDTRRVGWGRSIIHMERGE